MQQARERDEVRAFLDGAGISQTELAKRASVSQSTVSRAIALAPARRGAAREKLFTFIHNELGADSSIGRAEPVLTAFRQVWDGSDEHAAALAGVIRATAGLRPTSRQSKEVI
jgi:hypothetical protein